MHCEDCVYAKWDRVQGSCKLSPMGEGSCTYRWCINVLPVSMFWGDRAPKWPYTERINRRGLNHNCPYYKEFTDKELIVWYSHSEVVGQDGDWQENADEWSVTSFLLSMDALEEFKTYNWVDMYNLHKLSEAEFVALRYQWTLSRAAGWTSREADKLMENEIERRTS